MNTRFLTTGAVGTLVTGLCCFTPILATILISAGVAAWMSWLDLILLPLLAIFLVLLMAGFFLPPTE